MFVVVNFLSVSRFHDVLHRVVSVAGVARVLPTDESQCIDVVQADVRVLLDEIAQTVQLSLGKHGVEKVPEATVSRKVVVNQIDEIISLGDSR